MALPFILDETPLDSFAFALDGDGSLAIKGRDILVELDAYDIAGEVLTTFYFGSRGYNHPTAPDFYAPRLSQPLNFRRDIYASATTGGAGRVSYGEMRLVNNDGGLDFLRFYGIVGQRVRMLIGDIGEAYDTFEPLITGRVGQVLFSTTDLTIQLRDRLQDFAQAVQFNKYAGSNSLPDGIEGTDDIKDKPKPLVRGSVQNVSPPCVNTSDLIYQVNDGPDGTVEYLLVYDNGAALTAGAAYTDMADMMATAPSAGYFRLLSTADGSYFRLGATPTGTITCDVADRIAAADNTAARVALRIASRTPETGEGGITDDDVDFDDVSALDTANSSTVGIWIDGGETYGASLDGVLTSVGAWYGFDRQGVFRMQRLELPVAPYVTTFRIASNSVPLAVDEFNIQAYRFVPSNDPERGMPTWRVTLDYSRNFTVQPGSSLAGSVSMTRRDFLALATRTVKNESTEVQQFYPLAVEKSVSTLLIDATAAGNEAFRLLSIFDAPRDFLEIDAVLSSDLIGLIDLGSVVNIVIPRFDYGSGKLMRVIGMQYNAANGIVTLVCWG